MLLTILTMATGWIALTLWAEATGPNRSWKLGITSTGKQALIVYDPDPFYILDEQVCRSFAQGLADRGVGVNVATVAAANEINGRVFDLYVFCANTYNWQPDWAVTRFIEGQAPMKGKFVVAITLGSGSTGLSQKALERLIIRSQGIIVDSRSFWLLRPNDESHIGEPNVETANSIAYHWAQKIEEKLQDSQH